MKRNRQNVKGKRDRREQLNDHDPFEQKRLRSKKMNRGKKNKQGFSNQYEHELYNDNYEY